MDTKPGKSNRILQAAAGLAVLAVLFAVSRYNFLMFHGLSELFSIAVAWSLFLLVWSSRRIISNDALLFIGIAYGFIGLIDLVHTLAYKGMGVFPPAYSANTATQLWIAARGLEGAILLLFPVLLGRQRFSGGYVFWGFALLTAALLGSIFLWGAFPDCYIEGQGLTAFKKGAEYAICLALVLAMALLYHRRERLDVDVFRLMMAAMAVTVMAELAFTFYVSVYGLSNVAGHLFKIVSFYLVYLALVRSTVARPLATVFRGVEQEKQILDQEGRHLRLLHQTSSLFLESETLEDTIGALPPMIADHYAVPIVAIERYDADRQEMVFAGAAGIPKAEGGRLRVPVDQTISGTVATSGRAVIDLDVSEHADYRAAALRDLGVTTFACVPLTGQEGVIGTLAVADREERPDILDGADLLQAVADSLAQDIERHRQAERLRESEAKYRGLIEQATDSIIISDFRGGIFDVNQRACEALGYRRDELLQLRIGDIDPTYEQKEQYERDRDTVLDPQGIRMEAIHRRKDGTTFPVELSLGPLIVDGETYFLGIARDISERKQEEEERSLFLEMLEILNARTGLRETMQSLLKSMQAMSGCEAVGIRLRDGADFPYYETRGFPGDFVDVERSLCTQDLGGQLLRDEVGNPVLECMCGNVICGRFDPALPFFTEFGSFVSNGTSELLATTTEADRQARTRNRCNAEGYESVMLVPLRSGGETFGLLQFNDRRENRFSDGFVARAERLAGDVAMALAQRRAEEALKKSEERRRLAVRSTRVGLWETDLVSGRVWWDEGYDRLFGVRPGETADGWDWWIERIHPADRERVRESLDSATKGGDETWNCDYRFRLADGSYGNIQDRASIERGPAGDAVRVVGTMLDVTEAVRNVTDLFNARKAEADSEEKFRIIFENKGTATGIVGDDGVIRECNAAFAELSGYPRSDLVGKMKWSDFVVKEDLAGLQQYFRQRFENGGAAPPQYECGIVDRKGEKHTVVANVAMQEKNRIVSLLDITDRKRTENALQESAERLQKVFDSQLDAIFVLDAGVPPRIVACNKSASTIFGYEPEEMQGATTRRLHLDKAGLKRFQDALASALRDKGFLKNFEFTMKRKDASVFPSGHTVMELTDGAGVRTGWISVVSDLTERKKTEARLQQAQKMESIGTLAGGIAHDFNNILFPIVGMSELLLEDLPRDSIEYENAEEILNAGKRGRDLVRQILAFSRQTEHSMMPVRPQQILKEVVKLMRATIPSNIRISHWLQKDCGQIMADPSQLHQIAMNLVTNAFHAVEPSDGSLSIRLKETDIGAGDLPDSPLPAGRYARLTVSDTGPGIDPEHLDKIFDPYFTTKAQGKGTGLGLAVVYGIVREHDGDITVITESGKGSSFHVYLPLVANKTEPARAGTPEILPTGNERILLVDDESAVLAIEKQMLERVGYHVTGRSSSSEALKLFSADPFAFDLVISDMAMPDITGDKLAQRLIDIRPDIPIVICTGFSDRIDGNRAAAIGIKALLVKPVVKPKLAETVRKVLDDAQDSVDGQ